MQYQPDMKTVTLNHAARIWSYMASGRARAACDAIVVCCSYDLRVCDYACELLEQGLAPRLAITGFTGNWTKYLWDVPEAHVFRARAIENGVDPGRILIEDRATNFGENIAFMRRLAPQIRRAVFVTKPNSVLRVSLTIPVQWPEVQAFVDSPPLEFPQDVSHIIGVFGVMHEMVGDIDRILQYSSQGFQLAHDIPEQIMESWRHLIDVGFHAHLLNGGR